MIERQAECTQRTDNNLNSLTDQPNYAYPCLRLKALSCSSPSTGRMSELLL